MVLVIPSTEMVLSRWQQIKERILLRKQKKPITCPHCAETLAVNGKGRVEHWLCPGCGWDMCHKPGANNEQPEND